MKLHKDRMIQIVLAIVIVVLIGFVMTNNKNDSKNEKDLLEFGENLTDEVTGETEVVIEEKTVTVPKATTPAATTQPSESTATTTTPTNTGSCYPGLSGKKSQMPQGVLLSWSTCTSDNFQFYKLVKSSTNSNPSYPNDNVIMSTSNKNVGSYIDKSVARSMTYYYRVCVVERLGKVTCGNTVPVTY